MTELTQGVNWIAMIAGTLAAFALGMLWFSPRLFGKAWAAGSHGIVPPATPPLGALALQLAGTFLMAWIIGITAVANHLLTAILVILTIAILQLAGSLLSQKSAGAALVDGSYVLAMGVLMVVAQGVF
ncbi:MAG: hypothetical protein RLZZ528_1156 [Pseudomonadota bacterium]